MEQITTVGIDLAKNVFSLHGVDGVGRVVLKRTVRRDQLLGVVAQRSPCLLRQRGAAVLAVTARPGARAHVPQQGSWQGPHRRFLRRSVLRAF
jgi:hypothetical protein